MFGIEQIGKFFAEVTLFFNSWGIVFYVFFAFLTFIGLNVVFILLYVRIISFIPNIRRKIMEITGSIQRWLD